MDQTSEEFQRVKSLVQNLDSSIRERIKSGNQTTEYPIDPIEVVNFTPLSGMCGDKVIGINIKFGSVYYHIYILDEGSDPQVVKILGPKETSVVVTGFN